MKKTIVSLLVGACALTSAAYAAPVGPGGSLFPAPNEANPVGGTVVASLSSPFATVFYTGTLDTFVISGDTTNPYGGLTFVYVLRNDATSAHALARLTVNGYAGFLTDASYNPAQGGVVPFFIDRQANGDSLGFSFANLAGVSSLVNPGQVTSLLVIQTNAQTWTTTLANVIDGIVTSTPSLSPVPTPGAAALMGMGLVAASRRRRK